MNPGDKTTTWLRASLSGLNEQAWVYLSILPQICQQADDMIWYEAHYIPRSLLDFH